MIQIICTFSSVNRHIPEGPEASITADNIRGDLVDR